MANSPAPGSQLADYFFVAGLHDNDLLATYQAAKQGRKTSNDDYYYEQQQRAIEKLDKNIKKKSICEQQREKEQDDFFDSNQEIVLSPTPLNEPNNKSGGGSSPLRNKDNNTKNRALPNKNLTLPVEFQQHAMMTHGSGHVRDSSFGILDHVQAVIDLFDKERDTARDTVIAVHDQHCLTERFDTSLKIDTTTTATQQEQQEQQQQQQQQQQRQRSASTHVSNQSNTRQSENGI